MAEGPVVATGRHDPFRADPAAAARHASLAASVGRDVAGRLGAGGDRTHVPSDELDAIVAAFDLRGPEEVMLLALPVATALARPPISDYRVGAVGLEAETGDLLLGGNLEFPGSGLDTTVHAEGFVAIRSIARGTTLASLAVREARPCAHCRQTLMELAHGGRLRLIDPLGHALTLADLYPWPFTPRDLGLPGLVAGVVAWPDLSLADPAALPPDVAARLVDAGRRAHAPYSRCPAVVVMRLRDGRLVAGTTIESAAFDPTIGPMPAAIVDLIATGADYADVVAVYLAHVPAGAVDDRARARDLLAVIAPGVPLVTAPWATAI